MSALTTAIAVVTGSRELAWERGAPAIRHQLGRLPFGSLILHGDCPCRICELGAELCKCRQPVSADIIADWVAQSLGLDVERHPAEWNKYGRGAGPRRNEAMIDRAAESGLPAVVLAFPLPGSRGTIHCVQYARARGVRVLEWWES